VNCGKRVADALWLVLGLVSQFYAKKFQNFRLVASLALAARRPVVCNLLTRNNLQWLGGKVRGNCRATESWRPCLERDIRDDSAT
jgi:hypothetical protein